jgi:hypothetical protein
MVVGWMEGSNPPTLIEMTPLKHLKVFKFLVNILNKNPLVSKRLFSTVLNEEGYSYVINSPINQQILKLESHGSQLSGEKNRTVLSFPARILLQREYEKVVKNQKRSAHCKMHC